MKIIEELTRDRVLRLLTIVSKVTTDDKEFYKKESEGKLQKSVEVVGSETSLSTIEVKDSSSKGHASAIKSAAEPEDTIHRRPKLLTIVHEIIEKIKISIKTNGHVTNDSMITLEIEFNVPEGVRLTVKRNNIEVISTDPNRAYFMPRVSNDELTFSGGNNSFIITFYSQSGLPYPNDKVRINIPVELKVLLEDSENKFSDIIDIEHKIEYDYLYYVRVIPRPKIPITCEIEEGKLKGKDGNDIIVEIENLGTEKYNVNPSTFNVDAFSDENLLERIPGEIKVAEIFRKVQDIGFSKNLSINSGENMKLTLNFKVDENFSNFLKTNNKTEFYLRIATEYEKGSANIFQIKLN